MRLTKYEPQENSMFPYQLQKDELRNRLTAIHKLGQLEDIEEELGIDLIILFKALKNGIYIKPWKEIKHTYEIRTASDNIHLFLLDENDNDYSFKDYGKTWALTKEELEDEKEI